VVRLGEKRKQGAAVSPDELIACQGPHQWKSSASDYDVAADLAKIGAQQATASVLVATPVNT